MWEIISNPVTLSVIVMCVLCLCKLNVILSLLVSAMVAGFAAGMGPGEIMGGIITGLNGNGTNAIAYLLLGTFAAALAQTGLATMLAKWIASVVKERKWILLATLVVCAIISGTIIPVHIAYIPVLFPPLLVMMNKMKMDRRQAACVTEFGLVAPYVTIPLGYGVIFQGIVAENMTANGMPIEMIEVWPHTIILGAGMLVGLIGSWWFFRKPRDYQDISLEGISLEDEAIRLNKDHIVSLIAIAGVLFGQLYWDSMPLGALLGILIMIIGGAVKLRNSDGTIAEGIRLMGMGFFYHADCRRVRLCSKPDRRCRHFDRRHACHTRGQQSSIRHCSDYNRSFNHNGYRNFLWNHPGYRFVLCTDVYENEHERRSHSLPYRLCRCSW